MRILGALRASVVCAAFATLLALPAGAHAASCFGDPPDLQQLGTITVNKGEPQGINYTLQLRARGASNITLFNRGTFVRWRMPQRPEVLSPVFADLSAPPDTELVLPAARSDDSGASQDPTNPGTLIPFQIYGTQDDQVGDYNITLTARGTRSDIGACEDNDFSIGTVRIVCNPPTCTPPPCPTCPPGQTQPQIPSTNRCLSCEPVAQHGCLQSLGRLQWWKAARPADRSVTCRCGSVCTCQARAIAQGRFHTATFRVPNRGRGRPKLLKHKVQRCTPRLCPRAAPRNAWTSTFLQPVSLLGPPARTPEH
jgi:hypothetical protein